MEPETITSIKHPLVAQARALTTRPGRLREGLCLADGMRLVTQIVQGSGPVEAVLVGVGSDHGDLAATADATGVPVHRATNGVLRHALGTSAPPEAIGICRLAADLGPTPPEGDLTVIFDHVLDPGNVGSIIRTAVGFGAIGIVLTGDEDPSSRRVLDASRGAALAARTHRFAGPGDAVRALRNAGWWVVAADGSAPDAIDALEPSGHRLALLVGNESEGVAPSVAALADRRGAIPLPGAMESLNVAVAAGIGLWILRRHLNR